MKNRILQTGIALSVLLAVTTVGGCSAESRAPESSLVAQVVDTVADAVAENLAKAAVDTPHAEGASRAMGQTVEPIAVPGIRNVRDMVLVGQKLYSVFDGGVVIYDFADKSRVLIGIDEKLRAVGSQDGVVYVGGDYLYVVGDTMLQRRPEEFEGVINCLGVHGLALMIGTETGLYSMSPFGREKLLDGVAVTSMASEELALWVGTRGQGLYRWDGDEFRQRYLLREPHMFDTVYTLDFQHDHLYVGTTNGFHIHNGGRWQNLSTADGLPSNDVTSIDASGWVVYLATDAGVVTYFNGAIDPLNELAGRDVNVVKLRGRSLMAATDQDGILIRSDRMVRTLVKPDIDGGSAVVTLDD